MKSCLKTCDDEITPSSKIFSSQIQTCQTCHESCLECIGPSESNCTKCDSQLYEDPLSENETTFKCTSENQTCYNKSYYRVRGNDNKASNKN